MNTLIQTPTPNLAQSVDFYKKLNFEVVSQENPTIVADGKLVIEINPDRFVRAGVKLFRDSWADIAESLEALVKVHKIDDGFMFHDPSNVRIYLIEGKLEINHDFDTPAKSSLGNYAGMSLETGDFQKSIDLWEKLGFNKTMGGIEQGWIAFSNEDGFSVSFMGPNTCPHLFFNPSLTYFNGGKNLPVIQAIKDAGIPITEEITVFNKEGIVDNVIIRDPGGYGFFIFND